MSGPLVFAVSAHGFGHLGQTVPVLEALRERFPSRELIVFSSIPQKQLQTFLPEGVSIVTAPEHVTIAMHDALTVDYPQTRERFVRWHRQYATHVQEYRELLASLRPKVLLTNVDYTVISAACSLDVPVLAFCSLNWSDILDAFVDGDAEMRSVCESICEIYNSADKFLRITPAMEMPELTNRHTIDVLARSGKTHNLHRRLHLPASTRLVLLSLGGIEQAIDLSDWDIPDKTHVIVPDNVDDSRPDVTRMSALSLPYIDILASVDVLVTKPGYGSFCEAWRNSTSLIYVRRERWPEEAVLIDWIKRHCPAQELSCEDFAHGRLAAALKQLDEQSAGFALADTGEYQLINHLSGYL